MRFAALVVCLAICTAFAQPRDKPGCNEPSYVSRFPGSTIGNCTHENFGSIKMPLPKGGSRQVEGELDNVFFNVEKGHSDVEVRRNFVNAFQAAGFAVDYEEGRNLVVHKDNLWVWGSISSNNYRLISVREKAMQQQVVASAKDLETGLNASGHITANGILFDTDKADLKAESKAALDEIGALLRNQPNLKIYVVGHTDNQGNLAHNMELSKARAASVVKALETQYGVQAARMGSFGDGPYAPIASNDNEDGRARNRRVELVKQ